MREKLLAIFALFLALDPLCAAAAVDSKTVVVGSVSNEMTAFSSNDRAAFVATYVATPSILDDVAPYNWNSAGAWFDTVRPLFRSVTMTPGTPLEVLVDGNNAFVAVPFTISGETAKGKPFKAAGYWSGSLVRDADSWKISLASIVLTE